MSVDQTAPARRHLALGWSDIQHDAALLAERLEFKLQWRGIVAVARGGLVPAALVARSLGVRLIESVSIVAYQGEQLSAPQLLKLPSAAGDGTDWLVIDDLVDTGATMRVVREILPKAHVAVLYAKPEGRDLAHSYVREFPQDSWIDFPWEMPGAR